MNKDVLYTGLPHTKENQGTQGTQENFNLQKFTEKLRETQGKSGKL